jgi:hypothetical protein
MNIYLIFLTFLFFANAIALAKTADFGQLTVGFGQLTAECVKADSWM